MKITLVQARLHWRDPARNRAHLEELAGRAAKDADLVIFPETFTTGFPADPGDCAETMHGQTVTWMKELAGRWNAVVAGSIGIEERGLRNRFLWVPPGSEPAWYDKKHLFGVGGEDRRFTAGRDRVVIDFGEWRVFPQICYDLRFPVWCRNRGDYDLLLMVANWPSARVEAWDILLRARAIENQAYVVAVNRVGEDGNGLEYPGHSVVFDPTGKRIAFGGNVECCVSAELDPTTVSDIRNRFPFGRDADEFRLL